MTALWAKTPNLRKEIALHRPLLMLFHGRRILEEDRRQIKRWKRFDGAPPKPEKL